MDARTTGSAIDAAARHPWLVRWGVRAWLLLGLALAVVVVVAGLSQISSLVVPLVISGVVGALLVPPVDAMERLGVPRLAGAGVVLLALGAVFVGSIWLVVEGVVDQSAQISTQLSAGLESVSAWLVGHGLDIGSAASLRSQVDDSVGGWLGGAASYVPGIFSGVASLVIGLLIATFLLFYMLYDWSRIVGWVGSHVGLDEDTGPAVVRDAVSAMRAYFASLTISAVVTAVLIGITAVVLDVPLAFTIAVITLVTSYIPYLGAIVSGTFATLLALGAQGPQAAIIMLVIILVVQNVIQTVVLTKLTSDALSLHPIVALGSTIVGAALAGALGATLSSPAVAVAIRVHRRLKAAAVQPDTRAADHLEPTGEPLPGGTVTSPRAQA